MINVRKNILLKDLTTFGVGGPARYYAEVKNDSEVVEVVRFATKNHLEIFVIGGGSDILVHDQGFNGLVIKYLGKTFSLIGKETVTAEAGLSWDDLVKESLAKNLQGLECLSGIPGTVGAAPVQNIGAYGSEMADCFLRLRAYDFIKQKFVEFNKKECEFGYRDSFFKKPQNWQKYLITAVTFRLKYNGVPEVTYDSLKSALQPGGIDHLRADSVREAVLALRAQKLEDPKIVGNAGSFFKNPVVNEEIAGIPSFKFGDGFKLYAGWLIEKAGCKGKVYKNAAVSAKNALQIINPKGMATATEVKELSEIVQNEVYRKFQVKLEPEVQFIGFEKKVAILGYGLEGQDAEAYFKSLGTKVTILDRKISSDYLKNLKKFDLIVRSPGVYRYLPEIIQTEKTGVAITSALKIFFENCPAKIIGVTGTKGKGTTSTLIYEIAKKAGLDIYLAGNIGKPYLELLPKLHADSWVVMELSSFQLIDLDQSPDISVVLNIAEDHLDWHKNKEEYIAAKKNIVKHQATSDYAVINSEYKSSKEFSESTKAKVMLFSKGALENKFKEHLLLRGEHNLENIAAAVTVAKIMGIDEKIIKDTVATFKGLEHRLELVKTVGNVTFYNDSFATGPQPTIAAIRSFSEPETLILGGSDKGLDYRELGEVINETKNIRNIILIGNTAAKIKNFLRSDSGYTIFDLGKAKMDEIVAKTYEVSPKGGVVVLSPASASFDMFENYKDRGNQFKAAVQKLK